MRTLFALVLALGAVAEARVTQSTEVECSAKVALNRVYKIGVDRVTRNMKIASNGGSIWNGTGSYSLNSSKDLETFYLPVYVPYPCQ
ncbi:MAG: hypothetical protein HYR96_16070 [Deltaproteobacteria bacterium]|nr:hypothetical protein [Deltaproteobacteria bacterium]MBI3293239.1 hypothetical protein [Deltaproteobacteria bacterium]